MKLTTFLLWLFLMLCCLACRAQTLPTVKVDIWVDSFYVDSAPGEAWAFIEALNIFNYLDNMLNDAGAADLILTGYSEFGYNGEPPQSTFDALQEFKTIVADSLIGDVALALTAAPGYQGGTSTQGSVCTFNPQSNAFPIAIAKIGIYENTQYSYPVTWHKAYVAGHELFHVLGGRHTHECIWNGNNTAIDACPGFTDGDCEPTILVPEGCGTMMSYCTYIDINYICMEIHPQNAELINQTITNSCNTSLAIEHITLECSDGLTVNAHGKPENERFILEHSTDGVNFSPVQSVILSTSSFTIPVVLWGYYRLTNGQIQSNICYFLDPEMVDIESVLFYPSGQGFDIVTNTKRQINIYDTLGRLIHSETLTPGLHSVSLNRGIYFVEMSLDIGGFQYRQTRKIFI